VKKIPSVRITDLARTLAPECGQEIIGMRPGEKLHEEMISREDSHYTYEYGDYFKILPAINGWAETSERVQSGLKVPEGFVYSSDNNADWMSTSDIQRWLALNKHRVGII